MVDVAVAITVLVANTRGADLVGGGTAITTGQTFSLAASNRTDNFMVVLEETSGSTATVVFDAGAYPPSMRSGLGSLSIALAANDLRVLMLEGGRFIQSTGLITGTFTGGGRLLAYKLPIGPTLSQASTPTAIS